MPFYWSIFYLSERKKRKEGTNSVDEETKEGPLGWRATLPNPRRLPGADKMQTQSMPHIHAEEQTGAAEAAVKKSPFQKSAVLLSRCWELASCLPSSRKKSMKWLSEINAHKILLSWNGRNCIFSLFLQTDAKTSIRARTLLGITEATYLIRGLPPDCADFLSFGERRDVSRAKAVPGTTCILEVLSLDSSLNNHLHGLFYDRRSW